ncbi:MAG: iron ABC transporter permease [Propionibacteriaceae bacterium]|nr:iron ABC transporter permease [Propionibacteriaceae bacterium]
MRAWDAGLPRLWALNTSPRTLGLLGSSLVLVTVVSAAAAMLGTLAAFLVERTDLPGRAVWRVLLVMPLAMPSFVAAYSWVSTLRAQGLWWAVLILGVGTSPYVFLSVSAVLRRTSQNAEDVARSLGLGPVAVFRRVTFPTLRPALTAGTLLVALYTLSDFGAVSLLRFDSFTRAIFMSYRASFDRTEAAVLALLLMVVTLLITWAELRARGRFTRAQAAAHRPATSRRLGRWRLPAVAFLGSVVGVGVLYPVVVVVGWIITGRSRSLDVVDLAQATWATLWLCFVAAVVITVVSLPAGWLAARRDGPLIGAVQQTLYVTHALPGLVVALSLVFLATRYLQPIYHQPPLLILGYLVLFAPLAVGAIRTAVAQAPPALEEVAATLGHSPLRTFARVTLPLAAPGVVTAFLLVMLTAMKELPATLLLRPTGTETLATRLWLNTDELAYAAAAPYALALVLLATVPTVILTIVQRRATR